MVSRILETVEIETLAFELLLLKLLCSKLINDMLVSLVDLVDIERHTFRRSVCHEHNDAFLGLDNSVSTVGKSLMA